MLGSSGAALVIGLVAGRMPCGWRLLCAGRSEALVGVNTVQATRFLRVTRITRRVLRMALQGVRLPSRHGLGVPRYLDMRDGLGMPKFLVLSNGSFVTLTSSAEGRSGPVLGAFYLCLAV